MDYLPPVLQALVLLVITRYAYEGRVGRLCKEQAVKDAKKIIDFIGYGHHKKGLPILMRAEYGETQAYIDFTVYKLDRLMGALFENGSGVAFPMPKEAWQAYQAVLAPGRWIGENGTLEPLEFPEHLRESMPNVPIFPSESAWIYDRKPKFQAHRKWIATFRQALLQTIRHYSEWDHASYFGQKLMALLYGHGGSDSLKRCGVLHKQTIHANFDNLLKYFITKEMAKNIQKHGWRLHSFNTRLVTNLQAAGLLAAKFEYRDGQLLTIPRTPQNSTALVGSPGRVGCAFWGKARREGEAIAKILEEQLQAMIAYDKGSKSPSPSLDL